MEKHLGESRLVAYHLRRLDPALRDHPPWADPAGRDGAPDNGAWAAPFADWPFDREGIFTSFPPEDCTFRLLELPFDQPRKIGQVVALEAEGQLPFELEDLALEYLPVAKAAGRTDVLVAAADRAKLARLLQGFAAAGLDPQSVSAAGLCLYTLTRLEPADGPRCRAYLDLGARRTRLCVVHDGLPVQVDTLAWGGDDLTRLLAEKRSLEPAAAETEKIRAGLAAANGNSALLRQGLDILWPWLENHRRFLHRWRPGQEPLRWRELVLCGGGANLQGLADYAQTRLGLPTRVFRIPPEWIADGLELPPEAHPALAEPLALALADRAPAINFRKGQFAYHRQSRLHRRQLLFPAVLLALFLASGGLRFWAARSGLSKQVREVRARMAETVRQAGLSPTGDPLPFVEQKQKTTEAKLKAFADLEAPPAMQILAACSEKIPATVDLELAKFTYKTDRILLEGTAADFAGAKEIQDYLHTVPFFTKVVLDDTRQEASGRTRFSIQAQLLAPETAEEEPAP